MGAVYINGAVYGIPFLFVFALPLRPLLYLIVPLYAAILYSMRSKKTGCVGIAKAILWQVLPIWFILRIPNLSMAVSVGFTFLILLSIAVWKDWFEVNRKRTLITMWSLVILLPAAGMTLMIKMGYVRAYQSARLSAFIHPEGNDAGSLLGTIRFALRRNWSRSGDPDVRWISGFSTIPDMRWTRWHKASGRIMTPGMPGTRLRCCSAQGQIPG